MKKPRILGMCVLSMILVAMLNVSAIGSITVVNGGFDDVNLGGEAYYAVPSVPGWTFAANGGEAAILGVNGTGSWQVPTAGQCVVIYGGGSITQTITDFVAGTAVFQFDVQGYGRAQYGPMTVKLDGTALTFGGVAEFYPTGAPGGVMTQFTSDSVAVSAGYHTLEFASGDWAFIDNVSATNVPEPATMGLLLLGSIAGLIRRNK